MPDLTVTVPNSRVNALVEAFTDPPADGFVPLGERILGDGYAPLVADPSNPTKAEAKAVAEACLVKFLRDLRQQYVSIRQDAAKQAALDNDPGIF